MKKLLIIITIAAISYNLFSQKTIDELDNWSTYGDSILFSVKVSGETQAKNMYFIDAMPKIADEQAGTGTITKTATHIRVDIGGNEYKCRADTFNPDIMNLSTVVPTTSDYVTFGDVTDNEDRKCQIATLTSVIGASGTFGNAVDNYLNDSYIKNLTTTTSMSALDDYIGIYDYSNTDDRKISVSNFITGLGSSGTWTTEVRAEVTNTFIISTIQDEINAQDLSASSVIYGRMWARKIGDVVTVTVLTLNTTTAVVVDNYSLPSDWDPIFNYPIIIGQQNDNYIEFDGTQITIRVNATYNHCITGSFIAD